MLGFSPTSRACSLNHAWLARLVRVMPMSITHGCIAHIGVLSCILEMGGKLYKTFNLSRGVWGTCPSRKIQNFRFTEIDSDAI